MEDNQGVGRGGKSLCRLGLKFCPTPTTPIDEMAHYENFVKVRGKFKVEMAL